MGCCSAAKASAFEIKLLRLSRGCVYTFTLKERPPPPPPPVVHQQEAQASIYIYFISGGLKETVKENLYLKQNVAHPPDVPPGCSSSSSTGPARGMNQAMD
jgi:hypothetical protein